MPLEDWSYRVEQVAVAWVGKGVGVCQSDTVLSNTRGDIGASIDIRLAVLREKGEMAVSCRVGIAVGERRT